MGVHERESRRKSRRKNLKKIILGMVAVAGLLSVAIVAPNVLQAFKKLGFLPGRRDKEIVVRSRERLVQQGLLTYEGRFLRLTKKGERVWRLLEIKDWGRRKKPRWDGKWRVLIFDIPERRKVLRNKLTQTLRALGFIRLQDSVWLYPYDCEDLITLLKSDFRVGRDVLYLIVDELEYDVPYRSHFGLR
jgi:DNA-binding transcriptional regulator PaaX